MVFVRAHRRLVAWLAVAALGLGALAPTLAHALVRAGDGATWVQVCSSTGMFWVRADGGGTLAATGEVPAEGSPPLAHLVACPWCVATGDAAAPPLPGMALTVDGWPGLWPHAQALTLPRAGHWTLPPSRAPPGRA
jgi:hypothetical protein